MDIDQIVSECIQNPGGAGVLADRLRKTLRHWEPLPGVYFPPEHQQYCRINLLGDIVARGQKTARDMRRGDESLVEQGFTLLDEEGKAL
jgi:hypothetical protein